MTRSALVKPVGLTLALAGLLSDNIPGTVSRVQSFSGDGLSTPAGVGIFPAFTNLCTNSGVETDTTGWELTVAGTTITRTTGGGKFGQAFLRVVTAASSFAAGTYRGAVTSGHTYTIFGWVRGNAGGETVRWVVTNNAGTVKATGSDTVLTTGWTRLAPLTFTADATENFQFRVSNGSAIGSAQTYDIDGFMYAETSNIALPVVSTDGATVAQAAGRVQEPVANAGFSATQGWFAAAVKTGFASTDTNFPNVLPWLMNWSDDDNNLIGMNTDNTGPLAPQAEWWMSRKQGGTEDIVGQVKAWARGDTLVIVGYWTATGLGIMVTGASTFTTVGSTHIPTLAATSLDIGTSRGVAGSELNSNVLWAASGSGTLTNADGVALLAFGGTAPTWGQVVTNLSSTAGVVSLWDATTTYVLNTASRTAASARTAATVARTAATTRSAA